MLYQFLLYSKVNQLYVCVYVCVCVCVCIYVCIYIYIYIYLHPLLFGSASHSGHHRALSGVPFAIQRFSLVVCLMHNSVYMSIPISQLIPPLFLLLGVHTFVLCIRVSISALQMGSPVPFFQIPHTCVSIQYLFFLFLTYFTLCNSLQVHPCL